MMLSFKILACLLVCLQGMEAYYIAMFDSI